MGGGRFRFFFCKNNIINILNCCETIFLRKRFVVILLDRHMVDFTTFSMMLVVHTVKIGCSEVQPLRWGWVVVAAEQNWSTTGAVCVSTTKRKEG